MVGSVIRKRSRVAVRVGFQGVRIAWEAGNFYNIFLVSGVYYFNDNPTTK